MPLLGAYVLLEETTVHVHTRLFVGGACRRLAFQWRASD